MDFKKLEKANKIYQEIKSLDKEIVEIERYAMLIANGEVKLSLNINIEDLTKKAEEDNKVSFDEDGSFSLRGAANKHPLSYFISWGSGAAEKVENEKNHKHKYSTGIKENEALQILGILLYVRQTKRQALLTRLEKMGVVI